LDNPSEVRPVADTESQRGETHALSKLVGEAPMFLKAISQIPVAAPSDATVLISGETGTGKELVARAIHCLSGRLAFPFVAVNCGALTDTLLADELFGHERGAFTDAGGRRPGLLTQAGKGTLFLDEVEALTDRGQVMLLRVLEDRVFRPLGSSHDQRAHVRFLAATNASLWSRVHAGTFRGDLYYRLSVFSIALPPLRDRREDILPLAAHFLRKHASDKPGLALAPAAQAALLALEWPGNVRELENAIIRAAQTCGTGLVQVEDLGLPGRSMNPQEPAPFAPTPSTFKVLKALTVKAFEQEYLTRLMSGLHGNVTQAARAAGKDRRELAKLLKKHHLDPKRFTAPAPIDPGG
jgi:two-component system, NtrC family, response regulator GlrR